MRGQVEHDAGLVGIAVAAFDLFAWESIEAIVEAGYRYALEQFQAWPDLAAFTHQPAPTQA